MSIANLFEIPSKISPRQVNWLSVCAAMPGAKAAFGDAVTTEDLLLAQEAKSILADA